MEASFPFNPNNQTPKPQPDDSQIAGHGSWSTEERLGSIINHMIDGIITIDEQGVVLSFNPAAQKIFGYQAAEVIGQNINLLMPEPEHSQHDEYLRHYLDTGEQQKSSGIGREVSGRRKDGTVFPLDLAISEFRMAGQRYFTGIVRDITERKQAETQLRQQSEELAEVARRKDEFLGMLAHELRNPLAPIRNAIEVLQLVGTGDAVLQRQRDVIDRQVRHMARLLDDLLDVSRITSGKIELSRHPLRLVDVITPAVEMATPLIEARRHALFIADVPCSLCVEGDPDRLVQVIGHLLINAAKYAAEGGRIWLEASQEGDAVSVCIRDTGVGIAPEVLPRIFDLFARTDHPLARSPGGLGIGLTLVKRLVEMHGGTVEARSMGLGQGSEFIVRLPAVAGLPGESTPPETSATTPGTVEPQRPPCRVLVVDDVADNSESLAEVLELWGHEVRTVHDGPVALDVARAFRPKVVLLDIGMPGMDGYEVVRRLREEHKARPMLLVALTGYGQENDRRMAYEAGFNHHLVKPVDLVTLRELLNRQVA